MTQISLTPDPAFARVHVNYIGALGGTLYRTDSQGKQPVRGGESVTGDGILTDYECAFGEVLLYELEDHSDTTQLDVVQAWISHPIDPTLNLAVTALSDDRWEWEAPGSTHQPVQSNWPVVTHGARSVHRGAFIFHTPYSDQAKVKALFADGSTLLIRGPAGCPVQTQWTWGRLSREIRYTAHGLRWEYDYQRVAAEQGDILPVDPGNSWDALTLSHPTWDDVKATHPTWTDVLLTNHPHG